MIVPSTLAADFAQLTAEAGELGTTLAGCLRPGRREQPGAAAAISGLKVPLSVHEEMVHAHELRGEAAHDHEHV